jgi:hypothetical protein
VRLAKALIAESGRHHLAHHNAKKLNMSLSLISLSLFIAGAAATAQTRTG